MARLRDVFGNRRVGIQLPLGYASGLPLLLTGETLGTWMATQKVDLKTIGVFTLVGLSYNLKFLWAPLLDRYPLPFLGRRRGWMLVFQLALLAGILVLGTMDPAGAPGAAALVAVAVAFFGASHDVVIDGYRADLLKPEERAAGVSIFILGYRLGMLVAGAATLVLVKKLGWSTVYRMAGLTMVIGIVATIFAPEPEARARPPQSITDAYIKPFADLLQRRGAVVILALVLLYRFGYAVAQPMSSPFLVQLGFTTMDIGVVKKGVGLVATLLGGLAAGAWVSRLGTRRALLIFGATQAFIHLAWLALYYTGPNPSMLALTIGVENFFMGLATTAFDAYLMTLCNSSFSATQYAVLSSMTSLGGRLFGASSGAMVKVMGWPTFFITTSLAALPSLALLLFLMPKTADAEEPAPPKTDAA